jgi:hypothetical protein
MRRAHGHASRSRTHHHGTGGMSMRRRPIIALRSTIEHQYLAGRFAEGAPGSTPKPLRERRRERRKARMALRLKRGRDRV